MAVENDEQSIGKLIKLLDEDTRIRVTVDGQRSQFESMTFHLTNNELEIKVYAMKDMI